MSNPLSGAQRAAKRTKRLDWLRARPELLARLPGANEDVEPVQSSALAEALRAMQHAQVYAATTEPRAARWGIRLLVSELRGQAVEGKGQRYRS